MNPSPTVRCIIVEDDAISCRILEGLVSRTSALHLERSFESSPEAAEWLRTNTVDLIFADIEMPDMNGLQLIGLLENKPQVVVVSSKDKYALEAFEYDVTDYLVKPIEDYARFLKAVNRVISKTGAARQSDDKAEDIFVKVDSLLVKIEIDDMLWIEAFGDYVKIHTGQNVHTVYSTLKDFATKLPSRYFARVHRSFIVNLRKIENIDGFNLQIGKKIIPVSNSYRARLLGQLRVI